jgi:hypothetical protein
MSTAEWRYGSGAAVGDLIGGVLRGTSLTRLGITRKGVGPAARARHAFTPASFHSGCHATSRTVRCTGVAGKPGNFAIDTITTQG